MDQKRCSSRPFVDRPNYDLERFSSCSFAALRGQKEVAVAVAVLRGPPCPPRTKVLPLPFFVDLSVLRGQKRFSPPPSADRPNYDLERFSSWPFVDKRKLQSPLQFSAALRVLRGQMCCRCCSSWPFVDKRKLQSPLQFSAALRVLRGQRCCRCRSSWTLVSFVDKKGFLSPPIVDRPNYDLANLSSENRQRALTI